MHRNIIGMVLATLLLTSLVFLPGCDDDFDITEIGKKAFAHVIGNLVRDTFDRYSDDKYKDEAIDWVMVELNDIEWAQPYVKLFDVRSIAEFAWDQMWARLYLVARDQGMDVDSDGDTIQLYSEFVQVSDFPGLVDKMADMMYE